MPYLFLHVGIGAYHGFGQSLGLVTKGIDIVAYLAIAEDHTHATTLMSLGLSEDADARAVFFQGLLKIVGQQ